MCLLIAPWVTSSSLAARVKLQSLAAASKAFSALSGGSLRRIGEKNSQASRTILHCQVASPIA